MDKDHDSDIDDLELALALRRLADHADVPPPDPAREAALMAAFDQAQGRRRESKREYWGMAGLAAAATVLIAVGLWPELSDRSASKHLTGRHTSSIDATVSHPAVSSRGVPSDLQPPSDFVIVPGAAALPDMESGSLVRMDLPVSMLPSLGVTPPAGSKARVRADLIVGQDGLTRAVRLVD
jgi:anti-sigma factor RsiW